MKNIFNKFLLRVALLPSRLYSKLGVNTLQLKSILTTKLIMDDRRASGLQEVRNNRDGKETSRATMFVMLVSLLMGLLFLYSFSVEDDVTRMTIYFSFFVFMLALSLIADFTHVLIDVKDNYIILPKPVSPRTFLTARLLHIIIHLSKITVPMAIPGCIYIYVDKGIWGLVYFIPALILLTLFTIFIVNAVYLIILKIFTPEKFKSIISAIQIVFSILVFGSYQILPRMLDDSAIGQVDLSKIFLMWLYPPFWFAGAWKYLYALYPSPALVISLGLSVVMPLLSIWIVVKYLAPAFHRKLSMIGGSASQGKSVIKKHTLTKAGHAGIVDRLAGLFTQSAAEKGAFIFTWKMTGRSRDFKMKIYPQFGYMVVIGALFIYQRFETFNPAEIKYDSSFRFLFLSVIYFSSIICTSALFQIPYSDKFKSSWIFLSSPLERPGPILSGTAKASFAKFCLPVMIAFGIFVPFFFGPELIPNLLFGFSNIYLLHAMVSKIVLVKLPFAQAVNSANQGENTIRSLMLLLLMPIFAIPHFFIYDYPIIMLTASVVSLSIAFYIFQRIRKTSWETLKMNVD